MTQMHFGGIYAQVATKPGNVQDVSSTNVCASADLLQPSHGAAERLCLVYADTWTGSANQSTRWRCAASATTASLTHIPHCVIRVAPMLLSLSTHSTLPLLARKSCRVVMITNRAAGVVSW